MKKRELTEFDGEQFDSIYPDGIQNHYWNHARHRLVEQALASVADKSAPVMDVGCGRGFAVAYLREKGFDAWGFEPANPPLPPEVDGRVFCQIDMPSIPEEIRHRIRTVLLLDVIEHIEEPLKLIAEIRQNLPSLNNLIVTVPARQEIWTNYDDFNGHHRRYDRSMVRDLCRQAQLKPSRIRYLFHSLYPPAYFLAKVRGQRKTVIRAPRTAFQKWAHRLAAGFLYGESKCLPGALVGTSLLLVASCRPKGDTPV